MLRLPCGVVLSFFFMEGAGAFAPLRTISVQATWEKLERATDILECLVSKIVCLVTVEIRF
ncbi:hypothetical protein K450DRAFT_261526 [Umbelopsis ramanniana AG]|nr:uncharacterized protein K450DRAFT_261526 [Umbelopsis ramanniana AG]KAI8575455.1 hypothetical protein K450DRAFT_261526 [Umbelopsis ramanniana AG]